MKKQITLSADRRAVGISAVVPRLPPPGAVATRSINGKLYVLKAGQWVPASAGPAPAMAPNPAAAFEALWHKVFGAAPMGHTAMLPRQLGSFGATNPNFAVPSGFDQTTAVQATLDAANTLLTTYNGTAPSEHAYSSVAAAFQTAWNADPTIAAAGGNALLQVDGAYGPNTHDAIAAVNGGSAPDVNTAPASPTPSPTPSPSSPTPAPSSSNSIVNYWNTLPTWEQWAIGIAGVGGAAVVGNALWQKHGGKVKAAASRHVTAAHHQLRHHASRLHATVRRRHA